MASIAEVKNFIKSNYEVQPLDGGGMRSTFIFKDGRSQVVLFSFEDDLGLLIITSPFGKTEDITPKQAFGAPTFMGISLYGEFYGVTHVVPIADLDPSEVQTGIALVAGQADFVEEQLIGSDRF